MSEITAVVLAYNEADLLGHTLPFIKAVSDQVVIVDMESTDESHEFYDYWLGGDDLVLSYPRQNLSMYGFAHARNYGAKRAKTEWVLVVDCDEYLDVSEFNAAKEILKVTKANVFDITRVNYINSDGFGLGDIDELIRKGPSTSEGHRRLYRNIPKVRWEGMIHEELWIGEINAYYDCEPFAAKLHHLNQYKRTGSEYLKFGLYSYLTLQAIQYPALRFGTNEFWFKSFPRTNLKSMLEAAENYAVINGLLQVSADEILIQLASEGIVIKI